MKQSDVIRAWRDADFRSSLDADVRASLPASPAGLVNVDDDALRSVTGGCGYTQCNTCGGGLNTRSVDSCVTPPANCP